MDWLGLSGVHALSAIAFTGQSLRDVYVLTQQRMQAAINIAAAKNREPELRGLPEWQKGLKYLDDAQIKSAVENTPDNDAIPSYLAEQVTQMKMAGLQVAAWGLRASQEGGAAPAEAPAAATAAQGAAAVAGQGAVAGGGTGIPTWVWVAGGAAILVVLLMAS